MGGGPGARMVGWGCLRDRARMLRCSGGTHLRGPISEISALVPSPEGEAAARAWTEGDTRARARGPGHLGRPCPRVCPVHEGTRTRTRRLEMQESREERQGGGPAGGTGAQGSPRSLVAGARAADAPSWPPGAPGGRRARAARQGRSRPLPPRGAELAAGGAGGGRCAAAGPREAGAAKGTGRGRCEHPGPAAPRRTPRLGCPAAAAGRARAPFPAGGPAGRAASLGPRWLAATSAPPAGPPPLPLASRLHDNSAPTPRPPAP